MKIGIIGAGYIGRAVAQLAVASGHDAMLSNSRDPSTLHSQSMAIGCRVGTKEDAAAQADVVVLAIPFCRIFELPAELLAGKILVDPNNYYPDRDGEIKALEAKETTTSLMVAEHFGGARVVKALNAIFATDLTADAQPTSKAGRRALPLAADDKEAKQIISGLIADFGFDPVDAGSLSESWRFERGKPVYCVPMQREAMVAGLDEARREDDLAPR